ncbi:HTH domain-containing protein [Ferrimonas aestuarii]|uniref:Uncharacterized protein n=1 Tax=Ferrimonas aestuarii TaxID=2569539 RepID=A0A4U1BPA0_9GAMM|nr:HTH domain-containing protein [Ferrimonas aestuarii]TKB51948.1 hypothetical protein FCL42_16140 [Ferrimonas aestuarii]
MSYIAEMALEILKDNPKGLHVDEIALLILEKYQNLKIDADSLSAKLSSRLSTEFRSKKSKSRFSKVKNKNGSFKRGIYKAKKFRSNSIQHVAIQPIEAPSSNFVGAAGEHAVLSELLFRGYNAAIMTVDEGIDLVASKSNRYFHIQVKTASESASGFSFSIKKHIFENNDQSPTFYVLLCRRFMNSHFHHDYVILPSSVVATFINTGAIKDTNTISIRVSINEGKFMLNKTVDISKYINNFELIK